LTKRDNLAIDESNIRLKFFRAERKNWNSAWRLEEAFNLEQVLDVVVHKTISQDQLRWIEGETVVTGNSTGSLNRRVTGALNVGSLDESKWVTQPKVACQLRGCHVQCQTQHSRGLVGLDWVVVVNESPNLGEIPRVCNQKLICCASKSGPRGLKTTDATGRTRSPVLPTLICPVRPPGIRTSLVVPVSAACSN